jgi:uncharacterized protein YuzE
MALVTYDPDAKAMYVALEVNETRRVAKTIPLGEGKYLDVSEKNEPIGLEIILPRSVPQEAIDAIVNRGHSNIELLKN